MISKLKNWVSSLSLLDQPEFYGNALFEQELASKQVEIFLRVFQTLSSLKDEDEILSYLAGEIHKLLGVDCAVLMHRTDSSFEVRSHRGFPAGLVRDLRVRPGENLLGEISVSGRILFLAKKDFKQIRGYDKEFSSQDWECLFAIPLTMNDQTVGLLLIAGKEAMGSDGRRIQILEQFGQIITLAVAQVKQLEKAEKFNRRLEAEISATTQELLRTNERLIQRVRELKALYEVTAAVASVSTFDGILEIACHKLQDLLNVESVGFFTVRPDAASKDDLFLRMPSFELSKDAIKKCGIERARYHEYGPLVRLIFDAYHDGRVKIFSGNPSSLKKELALGETAAEGLEKVILRSVIALPLRTARGTLGVMILANPLKDSTYADASEEVLADEKVRTLTLIAARIASSLESVMQNREIQLRLADLSTLQEVSEALYATPVLEFVLAKIVKIMQKSLSCDVCTFLFYDPSRKTLVSQMQAPGDATPLDAALPEGFALDENTVSYAVFKEKKSRCVEDVQNGANPMKLTRTEFEQDVNSMVIVPLKVENEMIGVLRLGSKRKNYFNPHHLRLCELIGDRAAVIIQNAMLYEKVVEANRQLESMNRMKTEFVSVVSHELRTPVTAVKGFVDIVLSEEVGGLNDQQKKFLSIAHNAIERLTLLISDLLDISRIESGRLKLDLVPISLAQVLMDAGEAHRSVLDAKKIKLVLNIDKKIPQIQADPSRIRQVIDNLISNAVKFTTKENSAISLSADDMGDFLLVGVQDFGVGVKKEYQERIFEKFVQGDSSLTRQAGGTGLGLAICKSIIELHGGRIWVESEPGKGSTFRFLLPRHRDKKSTVSKIDRSS